MKAAGLRATLDARSETLKYRIAEGARMKVPYMCVIGRREAETGSVAVNVRVGVPLILWFTAADPPTPAAEAGLASPSVERDTMERRLLEAQAETRPRQAAARMDSTMGAIEELKGSLETLAIIATMAILPMFLFATTFYPLSVYPGWLQAVVQWTPLYHAISLIRGLALGMVGFSICLATLKTRCPPGVRPSKRPRWACPWTTAATFSNRSIASASLEQPRKG